MTINVNRFQLHCFTQFARQKHFRCFCPRLREAMFGSHSSELIFSHECNYIFSAAQRHNFTSCLRLAKATTRRVEIKADSTMHNDYNTWLNRSDLHTMGASCLRQCDRIGLWILMRNLILHITRRLMVGFALNALKSTPPQWLQWKHKFIDILSGLMTCPALSNSMGNASDCYQW